MIMENQEKIKNQANFTFFSIFKGSLKKKTEKIPIFNINNKRK